jgi:hypothetical protein
MKTQFQEQITQILACFSTDHSVEQENVSLLAGKIGEMLLFSILPKKEYQNILKQHRNIYDNIATEISNTQHYSYCMGLAGIGWFYQFMNDMGRFENDTNVLLEDFDLYLSAVLKTLMQNKDTDFLHGATGVAYYFYSRSKDNPNINSILQYYIDAIASYVEIEGGKIKLAVKDYKTGEISYNISLSHGMSAIVSVLARIYTIEAMQSKQLKQLIEGFVNYILAQKIDKNKYGSFYPYMSIESSKEIYGSRLAWCYGDLGIGITLFQVGKIMHKQDWINKAMEVLLYAAINRRDLMSNLVMDACLCHGSAGIGHVFYRMWWNTQLLEFKQAADYWFAETLKMAKYEDGLAGYKSWRGKKNGYVNDYGLLEGIAGIGLALTSYIYEIEPTWDKCLLLS